MDSYLRPNMTFNVLDDLIISVRKTWDDVGFIPTPLAISTTLLALLLPFITLFVFALTQRETPLPPPAGCHKIGLRGRSNLSDQYAKKHASGGEPTASNPWTVKALFIYPLKSCAPVELEKSDVIQTGLRYDRQFTFAQQVTSLPNLDGQVTSEWVFSTQRTFPRLAKVEAEVWVPDPSSSHYDPESEWVKSEGCLAVRFPFTPDSDFTLQGLKNCGKMLAAKLAGRPEPMLEFRVPFNPTKEKIERMRYTKEKVKIWNDYPVALNMGSEVPYEIMAKLKYTLGVTNPLTLFRIDTEGYREVYKNAPKKQDVGFQTIIGMQDSYPLHIMNLASVHHISSNLPSGSPPLSVLRYRPNIIVTGPPPFSEDSWTKARIGGRTYHISCRTTRCKLPNVDPDIGIADRNQPGSTMLKYRVIDQGSKSACLGMQVSVLEEGEVGVGDGVEVLDTGEHLFLKK
ncbi:hypothetical protein K458DRAFT_338639 [Lentithecium fluviatile CBS 122367]|uniref:MOSC domain-containing protein n=1 Tax=Lentithecium fluviatile CBS 122367 TaxID=1168545 RepID=A0A6G1J2Y3_9PLEO|nr:hypothetical protein K458DRAFT_338639 [Lentithecium fluviatile CBS 122367]